MRATIFLLVGLVMGGWLGWMGVSCASASSAASNDPGVRAYAGSCEQSNLSPDELRALVDAELGYSPGDSPRETRVIFVRQGEHANLEIIEDGHYDDSVRGESRSFELRYESGAWKVASCARELSCYRGKSLNGLCN